MVSPHTALFFQKTIDQDPEILSCYIHIIVVYYLNLSSSQEIENLKFGDFIFHNDSNGEYFAASKRLERIYASSNRRPWVIPAKKPGAAFPFPCPVKAFKVSYTQRLLTPWFPPRHWWRAYHFELRSTSDRDLDPRALILHLSLIHI